MLVKTNTMKRGAEMLPFLKIIKKRLDTYSILFVYSNMNKRIKI